jgi:cyclohexyl-isocyanide hydratase
MQDEILIAFLRRQAATCRHVTSVCTGSLVLAAAGLLEGYRATSHWASRDRLAGFGAIPVAERVVTDRNRITGGGVTAGIDFALVLLAQIGGEALAREIALGIEYAPAPPFPGDPATADPITLRALSQQFERYRAKMAEIDEAVRAGRSR